MKTKLIALSLLASVNAYAVVVTVDSGGFTQAVADGSNTPIPIGEGWVGVGFFSTYDATTDFSLLSGLEISNDFNLFGASFQFGGTGFAGFYQANVDGDRVGAASPFLGQNIISIAGNGSTLFDSTEAVIYRHSETWVNDEGAPAAASVDAQLGSAGGQYLFGGPTGSDTTVAGFDLPAIGMAALVPEPSVALLGAFGILGLLRRRR